MEYWLSIFSELKFLVIFISQVFKSQSVLLPSIQNLPISFFFFKSKQVFYSHLDSRDEKSRKSSICINKYKRKRKITREILWKTLRVIYVNIFSTIYKHRCFYKCNYMNFDVKFFTLQISIQSLLLTRFLGSRNEQNGSSFYSHGVHNLVGEDRLC